MEAPSDGLLVRVITKTKWGRGEGDLVLLVLILGESYLPFIAADINSFASERNMKLNEKKCKEMVITFLKYQPTVVSPMELNGAVIERVPNYKLLGVIISQDLTWNEHCDHLHHNKALKRLYALP